MNWPIAIRNLGLCSVGNVLWQHVGRTHLTIVVKGRIALAPGTTTPLAPPEVAETALRDPRGQSLLTDLEIAPVKPRAEFTLVGSAHLTSPATSATARVTIAGPWGSLEKSLSIVGDRARADAPPAPFSRMPILWERTLGDPQQNPLGVRADGGPNWLPVDGTVEPVGFGPRDAHWPIRSRFLRGALPSQSGSLWVMPSALSWGYFLAAPEDQHLPSLSGVETIVLENLVAGSPFLRVVLPGLVASAGLSVGGAPQAPIPLRLDTLAIDTDRRTLDLIWRGMVAWPDAGISDAQVTGRIDWPDGTLLEGPEGAEETSSFGGIESPEDSDDAGNATMALSPEQANLLRPGGAAHPFGGPNTLSDAALTPRRPSAARVSPAAAPAGPAAARVSPATDAPGIGARIDVRPELELCDSIPPLARTAPPRSPPLPPPPPMPWGARERTSILEPEAPSDADDEHAFDDQETHDGGGTMVLEPGRS